jgi:hypothetical protein
VVAPLLNPNHSNRELFLAVTTSLEGIDVTVEAATTPETAGLDGSNKAGSKLVSAIQVAPRTCAMLIVNVKVDPSVPSVTFQNI